MNDGSAPFWGALLSILVFIVAFGRDLSSRFFKGYDEVKVRLSQIEAEAASSATKIAQLTNDLEDERAKTRRERMDKEAAQAAATLAANERDTVKLENIQLDGKVRELTSAQATMLQAQEAMRLEIDEIKRDREERQKVYDLRLMEEQSLRMKAEQDRDAAALAIEEIRRQMQSEIDSLKAEIAELRNATNSSSTTTTTTTQTTHSAEPPKDGLDAPP